VEQSHPKSSQYEVSMDDAQIYSRLTEIFEDVFDDEIKVVPELAGTASPTFVFFSPSKRSSTSSFPPPRSANSKTLAI
jgi:hypothetical protein